MHKRASYWGFPGGLVGKNLSTNAGDTGDAGLTLGPEDPLENKMATHSTTLAWEMKCHRQRSLAGYCPTKRERKKNPATAHKELII